MVLFMLLFSLALIVLCVLCIPFTIALTGNWTSQLNSAFLALHWGHPLLLSMTIDAKESAIDVRLLGLFHVFSRQSKDLGASAKPADEETSAADYWGAAQPAPEGAQAGQSHEKEPETTDQTDEAGVPAPSKSPEKTQGKSLLQRIRGIVQRIKELTSSKTAFLLTQYSWHLKLLRWSRRRIAGLRKLFTVRSFFVMVRAGFKEPSETGRMFGFWKGIENALQLRNSAKRRLTIEPVFNEECLEIQGEISLQTSLARFAAMAVVMFATFPYFSTFMVWRKSRRLK
jgi:hypothetical protein